jgi:hypothetical protein
MWARRTDPEGGYHALENRAGAPVLRSRTKMREQVTHASWIELHPAFDAFLPDPDAVLRRIASDRKILEAHPYTTRVINPGCGLQSAGFGCETCHNWDGVPEGRGNCATVVALAEGWGWTEETP